LCGTAAGLVLAANVNVFTDATPVLHAAIVLTMGGAALLPDLDTPQSTAARSLGFFSKSVARGIDQLSLWVYHGTRTDRDVVDRKSGHRLLTHTVPGFLFFALLFLAASLLSPIAGAVYMGLLSGLLALGLRKKKYSLALSAAGGVVGYYLLSFDYFAWSILLSACVFVGMLIHTLGDWVTNSGVPITYPLTVNGKRWYLSKAPATFPAGGAVEQTLVFPGLVIVNAMCLFSYVVSHAFT
jgi:membrane-bound metal-dependent hydrolase YbcI (DUF457 family)